jgi:hypothetical protein
LFYISPNGEESCALSRIKVGGVQIVGSGSISLLAGMSFEPSSAISRRDERTLPRVNLLRRLYSHSHRVSGLGGSLGDAIRSDSSAREFEAVEADDSKGNASCKAEGTRHIANRVSAA